MCLSVGECNRETMYELRLKKPKSLVFRIRKRYFDAIVSGEKTTEFRPDSQFWRSRIDRKGCPKCNSSNVVFFSFRDIKKDEPIWRCENCGIHFEPEPEVRPDWMAVFICGKRVHRRTITLIQKIDTPTWFSEQGKNDVSTQKCYAIHLGREVQAP